MAEISEVVEPALAKINLTLRIVGRRPDSYHDLESLVVFCDVGETVAVRRAAADGFVVVGAFASALDDQEPNIAERARDLMRKSAGLAIGKSAVHIKIDKRIPVAAGLGGGSADAAATLRALNRLWSLDWPLERLSALAQSLGADVPACVESRGTWMTGTGEQLRPVAITGPVPMVLVNPGIELATATVFRALEPPFAEPIPTPPTHFEDRAALVAWLQTGCNDLQQPAGHRAPVIDTVLKDLADQPGCALARMSGSGATCFGLFGGQADCDAAAAALADRHPEWWVWRGSMLRTGGG